MSIYQMTAEQAVQNIASGIENSFKAAIRIELEKQAKPIIDAALQQKGDTNADV